MLLNLIENEIKRSPKQFFSETDNWTRLFKYLEMRLTIKQPEDWYRVSQKQINRWVPIFKRFHELIANLNQYYPLHEWEKERFSLQALKKSSQRMLRIQVEELFPQSSKLILMIVDLMILKDILFFFLFPVINDLLKLCKKKRV